MGKTRKLIFMALLVSSGLALHVIESLIPFPIAVPGAKLGLANIVTLLTLTIYGFKEGLTVALLRCVLATFIGGSVSSLIYSISGSFLSLVLMYLAYFYTKNVFSLIGISIIGAEAHNLAQITVASLILQNYGLYVYLPVLLFVGLATGYFVGLSTYYIKQVLLKNLQVVERRESG